MYALEKIRVREDFSNIALNYFPVKDTKVLLLYKIHNRLHNVSGRPVISKCRIYTKNVSSFLDHHFQLIAQNMNLFIKENLFRKD